MKEYLKEVLKEFIDEVSIEELNHLKFTMNVSEIEEFIEGWVLENAKDLVEKEVKKSKTIPLRKTFHLKVTVEKEEMCAD